MFLNDWHGMNANQVFKAFEEKKWNAYCEEETPLEESFKFAGIKILLATYSYENYSGQAFVLFERDGKLYEVNGSHCSCNQLEGQWQPEETTIKSLVHRVKDGFLGLSYGHPEFRKELLMVLRDLRSRNKKC